VQPWLKAIGHARGPLPVAWVAEGKLGLLERTGFPRRPRIEDGDPLVYYASVWRRVFAVVEAVGEPFAVDHPRWPWAIAARPVVYVADLEDAPPVEAIGVAARSMSQQSHIRLRERHYDIALEVIASAAQAER
jgi:hypothetical protein